jgi:hypothetical protein
MEDKTQPKRDSDFPSTLIYWMTTTKLTKCVRNARYYVSGKPLQWKTRCALQRTFFSKENALRYWPIATKIVPFVAHAQRVQGMKFQENPSNGSRETDERVFFPPSKLSLFIARSQPKLGISSHASLVRPSHKSSMKIKSGEKQWKAATRNDGWEIVTYFT